MSGQILRFDDSAHNAADAVLPWFVNGTLTGAELATVEQHLRECARCQREVDLLKQLQVVCTADEPVIDPTPSYRELSERIARAPRLGAVTDGLRGLSGHWQGAPPGRAGRSQPSLSVSLPWPCGSSRRWASPAPFTRRSARRARPPAALARLPWCLRRRLRRGNYGALSSRSAPGLSTDPARAMPMCWRSLPAGATRRWPRCVPNAALYWPNR